MVCSTQRLHYYERNPSIVVERIIKAPKMESGNRSQASLSMANGETYNKPSDPSCPFSAENCHATAPVLFFCACALLALFFEDRAPNPDEAFEEFNFNTNSNFDVPSILKSHTHCGSLTRLSWFCVALRCSKLRPTIVSSSAYTTIGRRTFRVFCWALSDEGIKYNCDIPRVDVA